MILVKTEAGQQVLRDRSVRLTPRQRSAFILFDGKRSVAEVLAAGMGVEPADIDHLVEAGLLAAAGAGAPDPASEASVPASEPAAAARSPQQRYQEAYPIATRLTAGLGLRGFRLNLAVEGATSYEALAALAPRIREAVGPEKAMPLERALSS